MKKLVVLIAITLFTAGHIQSSSGLKNDKKEGPDTTISAIMPCETAEALPPAITVAPLCIIYSSLAATTGKQGRAKKSRRFTPT